MRDVSDRDKLDLAGIKKQMEKQTSTVNTLLKDKEQLQGEVNQLNESLIELQETVSWQRLYQVKQLCIPFSSLVGRHFIINCCYFRIIQQ